MKSFLEYLKENEPQRQRAPQGKPQQKTATATKPDTDWSSLDSLFQPASDQPMARAQSTSNRPQAQTQSDPRQRATAAATRQATANIQPNARMADLLSRMRDLEGDEEEGHPEPQPVEVNTLPAVVSQAMRAAGTQSPNFHQVSSLPGNMRQGIRTLGRRLFGALTRTPVEDIWMVGNVLSQGPNTRMEMNAVAAWIRENGRRVTEGEIDFEATIPDYQADIQQWSAGGVRWLMVRDEFGDYVYSWPEQDSLLAADGGEAPALGNDLRRIQG